MSTMTETLKQEEALFIPSENGETEYVPKVAGEYLGHITDASTITREFDKKGRKHKARIFNFKVHVAQENTRNTYTYTRDGETHTVTGEHYVGQNFMANGVFRYLEPSDSDTFESNSGENKRYMRFCESLGLEIKTEERTVNGKTVRVQILPDIKETELNGTPVVAVVGRGDDWVNDEGKTVPSFRVKYTMRWEDGKRLATTTTNDLPF